MDYIYLRNLYNPNYIEKIDRQTYFNQYDKYSRWTPLTADEARAEDIYREKVEPNEWKFAAYSAAHGATAGLSSLALSTEEKELLGKYKQRSTLGQALGFMGSAAAIAGTAVTGGALGAGLAGTRAAVAAGVAGRAALGARVGGALGTAGRVAAPLAGEAAGITAYTGTERVSELVADGKPVNAASGLEIYKNEFLKNGIIVGSFSAAGGVFRAMGRGAAAVRGKATDVAGKIRGLEKSTQRELDKDYALRIFGVDERSAAKKITAASRKEAAKAAHGDIRLGAGEALRGEAQQVIRRTAERVGPGAKLADVETTLASTLQGVGAKVSRLRGTLDKTFNKVSPKQQGPVLREATKIADDLGGMTKHITPSFKDVKRAREAFTTNMFSFIKRATRKGVVTVRTLRPNFFSNLQKTKKVVNSLRQKATDAESRGIFSKIYKDLDRLEQAAVAQLPRRIGRNLQVLNARYSKLATLRDSFAKKLDKMRDEFISPSAARDAARLGFLTVGGGIGGGVIGGALTGTTGFILGSAVGAGVGKIISKGVQRPWRMSIYPDLASKGNRLIRGGRIMPDMLSQNVEQTVRRRTGLLRKFSEGIRDVPAPAYRGNFIKLLRDNLDDDEQKEAIENIKSDLHGTLSDPQKLNNLVFASAELLEQAGGSDFSQKLIGDTVQQIQKLASAFPPDRMVKRADDLMADDSLYSKKDVKRIMKRLEMFFDPDDVVEDWLSGNRELDLEQVQYLKYFHPEYFAALRDYFLMGMNGVGMKLSRKEKQNLSYLFGIPLDTASHPALLSITEQSGGLAMARQAQQREQIRKNLNLENKVDSLKTGAERSMLNEERV